MLGLCTTTTLMILLVLALILLITWWLKGDPDIESPRSQMNILEEAFRNRGFKPLIGMTRDFEKYNEGDFLKELQRMLVPFSQDREFVSTWLTPILLANLPLIMKDTDLLMLLDAHLRREHGYRLKPIHHVSYGIRPQVVLHATTEEQDVCFKEDTEVELSRGTKTFIPLTEDDPNPNTQGTPSS